MNLNFPGHSAPAAGFEVPLEMLAACHQRVQGQTATLLRLVPHLADQGSDGAAQQAATAVMRYFDSAGRHHHQDEELDLFPALLDATAGTDNAGLRDLIAALCADHRALEARWHALRRQLQRVAEGLPATIEAPEAQGFAEAYDRHIAREEAELLPLATRLLDIDELDRIGRAMRLRRGVAH
jgi:hemerythrin-like domain-containing protein